MIFSDFMENNIICDSKIPYGAVFHSFSKWKKEI